MNDLEHDLRELLQRKAGEARATAGAPQGVMTRGRRRQVGTVIVSVITTGLLVVASIAGVRGLLRADHAETPGGARRAPFTRTATIEGITMTSPSDWALIDEWPLARSTVSSSGSSCSGTATVGPDGGTSNSRQTCSREAKPTPVALPAGLPILQLTNFDPGLSSTICSSGSPAEQGDHVGLYVAIDEQMLSVPGANLPEWPVRIDENSRTEHGPCGFGYYAHFLVGGVPYLAFLTYGTPASAETIRVVMDAFATMTIAPTQIQGSPNDTPGYVLAGGTSATGDAWRLEVRPTAANVDMQLITAAGHASGVADFGVPDNANLEVGGGAGSIMFGAVTKEATGVELRPDDGGPIVQGTIFSLPPSLDAPFDGFFLDSGSGVVGRRSGQAVAVGPDGDLPEPANGGRTTGSPSAGAAVAQSNLRNALAVAKTFFTDGDTYLGFNPNEAASIEPSLHFNDRRTAVPGEVSIRDVTASTLLLVTVDDRGNAFCLADTLAGQAYGLIDATAADACSGTAALWGQGDEGSSVLTHEPSPAPGEVRSSIEGLGQVASIRIYRNSDGYCLEFEGGTAGTSSCSSRPLLSDRPYLALYRPLGAEGVWLTGTVPADVETFRVVAHDGRKWVQDVSGPAKAPDLGDVQLILTALSGRRGIGTIRFEDANGKELYPPVSFSWPIATSSGNEPL
jgi:hypothetical protein